ncbi:MAG: zinc finger domain-containing protein [Thermoproteota archaeon]
MSCGRPIDPHERYIRFTCLNCGEVTLWRCERCRTFSRELKCPKCGYQYP